MVQGEMLLVILVSAIGLIVLCTTKLKIHAFIALVAACYLIGFWAGMPILDIATTINTGFGGTLTSIGMVIILGCIMGVVLQKSGAAMKMADVVVKWVGPKRPALAMAIVGYIVCIPVFSDTGFIIVNPLKRALKKKTGASAVALSVALSVGCYATHTMVPPTPGPIQAATALGITGSFMTYIILGLIVAIPTTFMGYLYANWIGKRVKSGEDLNDIGETYEELLAKFGTLPNAWHAFSPIVIPILLIALGSVAVFPTKPFGEGELASWIRFLGAPTNALVVGTLLAFSLLRKTNTATLTTWVGGALKDAAIAMIVTGAGGALGGILRYTKIAEYLGQSLAAYPLGIFLPFVVSAAIKCAQGSATVSLVTASAIVAPLLPSIGMTTDIQKVLVALAIGAGSMTVSYPNDSWFWVVTEFSELDTKDAYKTQTVCSLVNGITGITVVYLLSLFLA